MDKIVKQKGKTPDFNLILPHIFQQTDFKLAELNPLPETGTTALVCVFDKAGIWTANLGNSRAILSRSNQPVRLSVDHVPDRK
jgi:serine/threonine protein phosphatase PrpC